MKYPAALTPCTLFFLLFFSSYFISGYEFLTKIIARSAKRLNVVQRCAAHSNYLGWRDRCAADLLGNNYRLLQIYTRTRARKRRQRLRDKISEKGIATSFATAVKCICPSEKIYQLRTHSPRMACPRATRRIQFIRQ